MAFETENILQIQFCLVSANQLMLKEVFLQTELYISAAYVIMQFSKSCITIVLQKAGGKPSIDHFSECVQREYSTGSSL